MGTIEQTPQDKAFHVNQKGSFMTIRSLSYCVVLFCMLILSTRALFAQNTLTERQRSRIDSIAASVLAHTGAPSASIAAVKNGTIVYEHAYGTARIDPPTPAGPGMRYSIGSVSKQFTSTAILLLAEERLLSLDDKISRWLPDLTRSNEVTIRQLLSMTAGYQDYWPHDYLFPAMLGPTTPQAIFDRWARKPLDFTPGTKSQYSNTNYVIAGYIVEQVSHMRIFDFLQKRVFGPLGMTSVKDIDEAPLGSEDAQRILRNGLGPLRQAPKEGRGWLFGAGELAMTAHDLALWDISIIKQTILRPDSYKTMQSDVLLSNGVATRYGLGVDVNTVDGRRCISHNGEVSGFLTSNIIYPDDSMAIVVFCNIYPGAAGPDGEIAEGISSVLFETAAAEDAEASTTMCSIFDDLQKGKIDRTLFSDNANAYFSEQVISDYATSLGSLGKPADFVQTRHGLRGGMVLRSFRFRCGTTLLNLATFTRADGKIEQYVVSPTE
jgi:D-alanyl-D-alanine carboxypeptidase